MTLPPRKTAFHSPLKRVCRGLAVLSLGGFLLLPSVRAGEPATDNADGSSAAEPRTDKNQYNLFNPTPDDLLRPFASSRPDQTTGPHSVDAGHYYLETGTAYSLGLGATRTDTWDYLQSTHFRAGLTNDIELELVWGGIDNTRTQKLGSGNVRADSTITGSTAMTVRTRLILIGNESEKFAFSIDPEVIVPTVSHHIGSEFTQGDVIFAVEFELPAGFSAIINVDPGIMRNHGDTRNDFSLTSGVTLYHLLCRKQDRVQLYLEYFDTLVSGSTDERQADVGVRWRPWENIQFDAGCNFGVSADAPDYQPFVGFVTRF